MRRRSDHNSIQAAVSVMVDTLGLPNESLEIARNDPNVMLMLGYAALKTIGLEAENKKLREDIEKANLDPVTGLLNRRGFLHKLTQLDPTGKYLICKEDLRNMKIVNDLHGHDAGDALLKGMGLTLTQNLRSDSTIARPGGDEFTSIIPLNRLDESEPIMNRLKRLHGGKDIGEICAVDDTTTIYLSARIGFAVVDGMDGQTILEGLRLAENALTAEKIKEVDHRGSILSVAYVQSAKTI